MGYCAERAPEIRCSQGVKSTLKLGLELIARRPIRLRLGTFFETWIATASGSARRTLGRDENHLSLTVPPGGRLAGTGRTHICQVDLEATELGRNGARPALLTAVDRSDGGTLVWGIRTNLFLDLADLCERAVARLLVEGTTEQEFALDDPRISVDAVAPGRYIVDVTGLLGSQ